MKLQVSGLLRLLCLGFLILTGGTAFGQGEQFAADGNYKNTDTELKALADNGMGNPEAKASLAAPGARASTLSPVASTPRLQLLATPNPGRSKTNLTFTLTQTSTFKLEVLDRSGAVVKILAQGAGKVGDEKTFTLKRAGLPSGVYIARLITPGEVCSTRFVFEK